LEAELSPVNRKMIKTLGLEIAGAKAYPVIDVVYSPKDIADGFPSFRNPTVEELHWFYAALRALTQIHPLLQQVSSLQHYKFSHSLLLSRDTFACCILELGIRAGVCGWWEWHYLE
jgi:hypothetical protein